MKDCYSATGIPYGLFAEVRGRFGGRGDARNGENFVGQGQEKKDGVTRGGNDIEKIQRPDIGEGEERGETEGTGKASKDFGV